MKPIGIDKIFPNAEIVAVQGKPYIFSNLRIDRDSIPKDLYAYDVRDADCDGQFWEIAPRVLVNHWGTIIGAEPIKPDEGGATYYCPPDETNPDLSSEGCFLDWFADSTDEYLLNYEEMKSSITN